MSLFHIFLGIIVAAAWGINFIFVKFGLNELPPLFLCGLRFLFFSIPLVFFIKKPKVKIKDLFIYSTLTFTIQFSLLFLALYLGMPAGVASLVFQVQMFISLFIAAIVFKEKPSVIQIYGGILAFIGIIFVWLDLNQSTSTISLLIEIAAATAWAIGNIYSKKMHTANSLSLVAWGCLIATPPLMMLSLIFEGPSLIWSSILNASWVSVISVTYTTFIATGLGYALWNKLLSHYPVTFVIPFTLLVPVFGIFTAMLIFNEPLTTSKLIATLCILLGLSMNVFSQKILKLLNKNISIAAINTGQNHSSKASLAE